LTPLREIQRAIRSAIVDGNSACVADLLVGGANPKIRLAVHHRHYHASLVRVLAERFPATAWLAGSPLVNDAARDFVETHPPAMPCLAEYGGGFPAFLDSYPAAVSLPYLGDFALLEWYVGQVAVEVKRDPVTLDAFAGLNADALADAHVSLQPGVRFVSVRWNVDELMTMYLTDSEPEGFSLVTDVKFLEVCGARGDVRIHALRSGDFTFRCALVEGRSLADAAERAAAVDERFDPGQGLVSLASAGLISEVNLPSSRSR
jgi:hypothetical protein